MMENPHCPRLGKDYQVKGMEQRPQIHKSAFIAPGAVVLGDVTIGEDAGIWYHATVRGDRNSITVGSRSNIQDNVVIHVTGQHGVRIGESVTVGHSAILHGCTVGDRTLIGMGAIVLDGAQIGADCIVGAGALVLRDMVVPDGSLVLGNPAKIKRPVTEEEIAANLENAMVYVEEAHAKQDISSASQ